MRSLRAFSLVEVTLALGIASFGLVAAVGLIPVGLTTMRDAMDDTAQSMISHRISSEAALTPFAELDAKYDGANLYFDDEGQLQDREGALHPLPGHDLGRRYRLSGIANGVGPGLGFGQQREGDRGRGRERPVSTGRKTRLREPLAFPSPLGVSETKARIDMITGGHERRGRRGFTLIEILVAIAVLSVLMVLVFSVIEDTSRIWRRSTAKIEAFQDARNAFQLITRTLSQATLNVYYDYFDSGGSSMAAYQRASNSSALESFTPDRYGRQSELSFQIGPNGDFAIPERFGLWSGDLLPGTGQPDIGRNQLRWDVHFAQCVWVFRPV